MPADVTGTTIVVEGDGGRDFAFRKGPIFAQIVLADEINRATPKTQSSLLEAMPTQTLLIDLGWSGCVRALSSSRCSCLLLIPLSRKV